MMNLYEYLSIDPYNLLNAATSRLASQGKYDFNYINNSIIRSLCKFNYSLTCVVLKFSAPLYIIKEALKTIH